MSKIATVEHSPEKAGVGGSIPSLATMFSITSNFLAPENAPRTLQILVSFHDSIGRDIRPNARKQ